MKKTSLLLLLGLLILRGSIFAQNPYESLGKVAPVLTLSEGKYQEFMTNDTVVQIGSVLFNTITNEVVSFLEEDSLRTMEADMMTRFLSVDPIGRKFPELTPYQFASNTPIQAIDLDGLEALIINKMSKVGSYNVFWQNYSAGVKPQADKTKSYNLYTTEMNSKSLTKGRCIIALKSDADVDNDNSSATTGGPQQGGTSFKIDGKSLDPDKETFFVKPTQGAIGKALTQKGLVLGDLGIAFKVQPDGSVKSTVGIIGDNGPKGMTGEIATHGIGQLGANTNPDNGGVEENSVFYFFFLGLPITGNLFLQPPKTQKA